MKVKLAKWESKGVCKRLQMDLWWALPPEKRGRMSKLFEVLLAEESNQDSGGFGRLISEWAKFCGSGILKKQKKPLESDLVTLSFRVCSFTCWVLSLRSIVGVASLPTSFLQRQQELNARPRDIAINNGLRGVMHRLHGTSHGAGDCSHSHAHLLLPQEAGCGLSLALIFVSPPICCLSYRSSFDLKFPHIDCVL
ncbi:unnamed protein product [Sphenostylis stenocarpa]|uniref:Uncharacterized protein n=1 Tax=Sphenostylis stenocarpa TaxID=92480 RepID=A0AA86VA27_9FABA|nr:unnamed protein product [Sphenostylis stenocarpa]